MIKIDSLILPLFSLTQEKQEALRKAGKASKTEAGADVPQSEAPTEVKPEDEDGATTSRKRRVIDSDDE